MERIDGQLLALLDGRARAARRVGELRRAQVATPRVEDHAALSALLARAAGDMPVEPLGEILGSVFAACLSLELPVRVAFAGEEGGAAHAAASGRFGHTAGLEPAANAAGAVDDVARKRTEFAVLPLESSQAGVHDTTVRALAASDLRLIEVLTTKVDLHLMSRGGELANVRRVCGSTADVAACRASLARLGLDVAQVATPLEACRIAADDADAAALGLEPFGARVGLTVARRGLLDGGAGHARYAVAGARPSARTGHDATSFAFGVAETPGALLAVLQVLVERSLPVEKIHAVPGGGAEPWSYLFYAESPGHFTDRALVMAFEEMKRAARLFKVLGSYPTTPR